jgi:hypothetical protein
MGRAIQTNFPAKFRAWKPNPIRVENAYWKRMGFFASGLVTVLSVLFLVQGCGLGPDRVTGTSSGVDNPQLTVAFVDTNGVAMQVSGTVSLFGEDQNPAVVSSPLATIRVDNSGFVNLSGLDFDRSGLSTSAYTASTLYKKSALDGFQSVMLDSLVKFNIYLKTEGRLGALAMGLAYDGKNRRFVVTGDTNASRVDLRTKPLRNVQGILTRKDSGQGPDRLFIPGTPFVSVLVDTVFEFMDIPEGLFELRLLTGEGNVVKVKQPFNSTSRMRYTVDEVTSIPLPDTGKPVDFGIQIRADSSAVMQFGTFLEGHYYGIQPGDGAISWLWRLIEGPTQTIGIKHPTQSATPVQFYQPGLYSFELSGTVGTVTHRDTARIAVEGVIFPGTRFLAPGPQQVITLGRNFKVVWQSEVDGPCELRLFLDQGFAPVVLDSTLIAQKGLNEFEWNVDPNFPEANRAGLSLYYPETDSIAFSAPFSLRRNGPR